MIQEFDYNVNLMRSILWRMEGAPRAIHLSQNDQDYINSRHSKFWVDWFNDVFNLLTCNEFGIKVWGRILDFNVTLELEARADSDVVGYDIEHKNFERGNFNRQFEDSSPLSVSDARKVLLLRWHKMTHAPTCYNINRALDITFGRNKAFMIDNQDMTMTYVFKEPMSNSLRSALESSDALPRPAGVNLLGWIIQVEPSWGFENRVNFDNAGFAHD